MLDNIVLENDRVLLRPLSLTDINSLLPIALQEELWKLSPKAINNKEDLGSYIKEALSEREKGASFPFIIIDKLSGEVAGSTRYGNISLRDKRLEIGWTWLSNKFHGKGLNKQCKFLLLKYAFEELDMNRVELKTDSLNLRSRAAIKKIGASEEGVFRRHMITESGRVRDSVYFSIIKEEWPTIKQTVFNDLA